MKKIFALAFAIMMLLTALVGCNTTPPPNSDETQNQTPVTPPAGDIIPEYDGTVIVKPGEPTTPPKDSGDQPTTPPESGDQPDTPPESGDQPTTPPESGDQPDTPPKSGDQPTTPSESGEVVTGDFVTKYKTYTYEGNNLAIIKLENHTTQNYTVTINAKYLDAAGNELKAETQTFEGFPAGWENHLVFKPDIQFAKFTYTVNLNAFNGKCALSANSKAYFKRLYEGKSVIDALGMAGDHTKYPTILIEFEFANLKGTYINTYQILFDNTGEIYFIKQLKFGISNNPSTRMSNLLQTTDETIVWPDELKGNVTGIVSIQSVTQ